MGMFDTVIVPCPKCGKKEQFQSKSGECSLRVFRLKNCPDSVLEDINRHAPFTCECGTVFEVDLSTRQSAAIKKQTKEAIRRRELLRGFREWYDNLSQEEMNWYEGKYEGIYLDTL